MRKKIAGITVLACGATMMVAPAASAGPKSCDTRVNNTIDKLLECVGAEGAYEHLEGFQAIADANDGTRASGTSGYDASVDYVVATMEAAGYEVTVQPFTFPYFEELQPAVLEQVSPVAVTYPYFDNAGFATMSYSGSGDVTAPTQGVNTDSAESGCDPLDFVGFAPGSIAVIKRGACTFALKAANAEAAGAVGVVIYNDGTTPEREVAFLGTLGSPDFGIPVVGAATAVGEELAVEGAVAHLMVDAISETRETANVLAESPGGDPSSVVMAGAHLDSVEEGPGINDNGSGSAAILEVAEQLAKVKPVNKLRFAWWGAEESGLLGSWEYILTRTDEELEDIALYLNFDMVASPNYMFGVYDGDGSTHGLVGPAGSDDIEATFEDFYEDAGLPYQATEFSGRSDYQGFIAAGIPAGGLFTGAEGIKSADEAALYGGVAGAQYDPCYHLACDTLDNVSMEALDVNTDAIAYATLSYAMSTEAINGGKSKGNFKPEPEEAMD